MLNWLKKIQVIKIVYKFSDTQLLKMTTLKYQIKI